MLILHDPDCLLHETVEFIGAKTIPAYESPARLQAILTYLQTIPDHQVKHFNYASQTQSTKRQLLDIIASTHETGYLTHLQTVFTSWRTKSLVEDTGTILPECFPFPTSLHPSGNPPKPPNDIYARTGYYSFDMSTGITADTWTSTIASANLAAEAVRMLFPGPPNSTSSPAANPSSTATPSPPPPPLSTILALTRPPGHHCDGHRAGGYCYLNNAAIAVSVYRSLLPTLPTTSSPHNAHKIAILDLDFHHGNGTQELFYSDPNVLYISIHGEDEFPYYTGAASETGEGKGEGMNVNLPLKTGSGLEEYLGRVREGVEKMRGFGPAFVVVSLGFDTFGTDPLGGFGIGEGDYVRVGREARRGLGKGVGVKTVVLLEGGYVVEKLGGNLGDWIRGWEQEEAAQQHEARRGEAMEP